MQFQWKSVYDTKITFENCDDKEKKCRVCNKSILGLMLTVEFQDDRPDNEPRRFHHKHAPISFFKEV